MSVLPPHRTAKAFLSYSSANREYAEKLAADLRGAGISIWFDQWEIAVGESIIKKIQSGVEENDFVIVVLSQASVASDWVRRELNLALMNEIELAKVILLPVLIEDCSIPPFLKEKKYADFRESYPNGLSELVASIFSLKKESTGFDALESLRSEWEIARKILGSDSDPYFLTLSEDSILRVWELPTGKLIRCIFTRHYPIDAEMTRDGKHIVVSMRDNWGRRAIVTYDLFSSLRIRNIGSLGSVTSHIPASNIACLDNRLLAAVGTELRSCSFSGTDEKTIYTGSGEINTLRVSSDGKFVAFEESSKGLFWGSSDGGFITLSELQGAYDIAVQRDTGFVACGYPGEDGTLLLKPHSTDRVFLPHTDQVSSVAFSSNGRLLAAGDWDGGLYLYTAPDWKCIGAVAAHPRMIGSVSFCYHDQYLITGTGGRGEPAIKIWNVKTGKLECKIFGTVASV
jgi:WD40 repeat protein